MNSLSTVLAMLKEGLLQLLAILQKKRMEQQPVPVPTPPITPPKYDWSTPETARHSVRLICDEMGLALSEKNLLCQVIRCESGFKSWLTHKNADRRQTVDNGICQFNDYWYASVISPHDALHNPEKAVRTMIKSYRAGRLKDWVCYDKDLYLSHQP